MIPAKFDRAGWLRGAHAGTPPKDAKPEVLAEGINPKSVAARLTLARWSDTRCEFNGKLVYEPRGLA